MVGDAKPISSTTAAIKKAMLVKLRLVANILSQKKLQLQTVTRKMQHKALAYKKVPPKMLVKLRPGLNFINIPRTAFTHPDPKCAKKDSQVSIVILCFYALRA